MWFLLWGTTKKLLVFVTILSLGLPHAYAQKRKRTSTHNNTLQTENRRTNVHTNRDSKGLVRDQIIINKDLVQIRMDTKGSGNFDYLEIQKGNIQLVATIPIDNHYKMLRYQKRNKNHTDEIYFTYDYQQQKYILTSQRKIPHAILFQSTIIENTETSSDLLQVFNIENLYQTAQASLEEKSEDDKNCSSKNNPIESLLELTGKMPIVQNAINTYKEVTEIQKNLKNNSIIFDNSCKNEAFNEESLSSLDLMAYALGVVAGDIPSTDDRPSYLQCMKSNNLGHYANRIKASIQQRIDFPNAPFLPLISCAKNNGSSLGSFSGFENKIYIHKTQDQINSRILKSDFYPNSTVSDSKYTLPVEIAKKNYERVLFHELIHSAGIRSEPFTHAIEECCGGPSSPNSPSCKEMRGYAQSEQNVEALHRIALSNSVDEEGKIVVKSAISDWSIYSQSYLNSHSEYNILIESAADGLDRSLNKNISSYLNCSTDSCKEDLKNILTQESRVNIRNKCESLAKRDAKLIENKSCEELATKFDPVIAAIVDSLKPPETCKSNFSPIDSQSPITTTAAPPGAVCGCLFNGVFIPKTSSLLRSNIYSWLNALIFYANPKAFAFDTEITGEICLPNIGLTPRDSNTNPRSVKPSPGDASSPGAPSDNAQLRPLPPAEYAPNINEPIILRVPLTPVNANNPGAPPAQAVVRTPAAQLDTSIPVQSAPSPRLGSTEFREDVAAETRRSSALIDTVSNVVENIAQAAIPAAQAGQDRARNRVSRNLAERNQNAMVSKPNLAFNKLPTGSLPQAQEFNSNLKSDSSTEEGSTVAQPVNAPVNIASSNTPAKTNEQTQQVGSRRAARVAGNNVSADQNTNNTRGSRRTPASTVNPESLSLKPWLKWAAQADVEQVLADIRKPSRVRFLIDNKIQFRMPNGRSVGSTEPQYIYEYNREQRKFNLIRGAQ